MTDLPVVFLAVLAKNKSYCIKEYLSCLASQTYPKNRMILYIRANNCNDDTIPLIRKWVDLHLTEYHSILENYEDLESDKINDGKGEHDWDHHRFSVLARIRQDSVEKSIEVGADRYFVVDVDNFLAPKTLRSLVDLNLDYVGPLLPTTKLSTTHPVYANVHVECDTNGYYADSPFYFPILKREIRGLFECKVVHTCYLIKTSVIGKLSYIYKGNGPASLRHEYVIWSETCRNHGIKQYIDNREFYGLLIFQELEMEAIRKDFRLKTDDYPE